MKNKKKFGRKLTLNKQTIARLDQKKVIGGRTMEFTVCLCPCRNTELTDACTFVGETCEGTCGEDTCECTVNCITDICTNPRIPCPCQEPLTY
jgi:hypothetical protein